MALVMEKCSRSGGKLLPTATKEYDLLCRIQELLLKASLQSSAYSAKVDIF